MRSPLPSHTQRNSSRRQSLPSLSLQRELSGLPSELQGGLTRLLRNPTLRSRPLHLPVGHSDLPVHSQPASRGSRPASPAGTRFLARGSDVSVLSLATAPAAAPATSRFKLGPAPPAASAGAAGSPAAPLTVRLPRAPPAYPPAPLTLRWPLSGLLASSSSSPPEAAGGGAPRPRSPGCWAAAAAGKAVEAAAPATPGLSVTLCAFSPQRHGYTMKSLKPGLVGMSGGGGSGSPPPLHVGLIGVVLMTDTSTLFGESWQKITGGGCGGLSVIGASTPRIISRPRSAAPAAAGSSL